MSDNNKIVNINNPVPILQQPRSSVVTTNPFIPNEVKEIELEEIDQRANEIIKEQYKRSQASGLGNMTIKQIGTGISVTCIGILDDLFKKPQDTTWSVYGPEILQKDGRYGYIGILMIVIALLLMLFDNNNVV
jgi:hypothetical protein